MPSRNLWTLCLSVALVVTTSLSLHGQSTFGTVNDDVLAHFDPTFVRDNFVEVILNNTWPE